MAVPCQAKHAERAAEYAPIRSTGRGSRLRFLRYSPFYYSNLSYQNVIQCTKDV
jgi:hypothetical protein